MVVFIIAKEALVLRLALLKPPTNLIELPVTSYGLAKTKITEKVIARALRTQAVTIIPGPNKINFQILQMIWSWNKARITNMVYYVI